MPTLVPIPWQPHLVVAPSYLARLEKASELAGHKIYLNSIKSITGRYLSAWRALEEAIYVFDLYKNHGGPVASDPYKGKRYHLRGAGGDIRDKADRKYMLAAGFLPDPDEWWHFSDPNWANMPVIAINVQTAGHNEIPLNTDTTPDTSDDEENDMTMIYLANSDGTVPGIFDGWRYMQLPSGELRPMSAAEWGAFETTHPGFKCAPWSGASLSELALACGLLKFTGSKAEGMLGLTGETIGRNATKEKPRGAIASHWPRSEPGAAVNVGF